MRISLLSDGIYPYVIGGMQKHSFYLAKYLAANGVHVDLYHTNKSNYDISLLEFFSESEKKMIRSFVVEFPCGGKLPGHYIRASYLYSSSVWEIFKKNSEGVDFVYAKGFAGWKLLEEKSKGVACPPVGVNFHGYEMFQKAPDLRSWFEQRLLRKPVLSIIRKADHVFSYGGKITDILKELVEAKKIIELPAGIESSWLRNNEPIVNSPLRFVFIGRYERRKGLPELNLVLQKLLKDHSFEFVFIGPIPEEKRIVSKKIRYLGGLSDTSKIQKVLHESDVLVCPSHSEGMPNVILEAMASGLAIIASDVGAVKEMVSHENGILITPGSIAALEEALVRIMRMEQASILKMKNTSLKITKEKLLWESLILRTVNSIRSAVEHYKS